MVPLIFICFRLSFLTSGCMLGGFWGPFGSGTSLQAPLAAEVGARKLRTRNEFDFGRIWEPSWGSSGSFLRDALYIFDTKVESFFKLFLKPLPERLQDQFRIQMLTKSWFWGEVWMYLKTLQTLTDFILTCFLLDDLPRPALDPASEVFLGFRVLVGTLSTSIWESAGDFGCRLGSQGGGHLGVDACAGVCV